MVNNVARLDAVFGALADPTRRAMVSRLARGTSTVGDLGAPFSISKAAVTKHVKVLERAGLLRRQVDGRVHHCEIDPAPLSTAQAWVDEVRQFWENRLDDLAAFLDSVHPPQRRETER